MTVELRGDVSHSEQKQQLRIHKPEYAFSGSSYITGCHQGVSGGKRDKTNVFRGAREVNLLTSILEIFFLGKTNLQISCDEYHMRCYGSLMGRVGRAICECSLVIVSLKRTHKVQQPALIRLREDGRLI
jgi:hypothetical protein